MVLSLDVRPRPAFALLLLLSCLLLPALWAAEETPVLPAVRGTATVDIGGRGEFSVAVAITPAGPLFALAPLVQQLGGALKPGIDGSGNVLELGDKRYLFGPDSSAMVLGQEVIPLSQQPQVLAGGIQVPLDLLQRTYGEAMGNGFVWDREGMRLTVDRRGAQELPVLVDAVHVRGTTTLVLEFPQRPRFKVVEDFAAVEVQMLGDRIDTRFPAAPIRDPLVRAVRVSPERVRIELDPQAQVSHYTLSRPFRLVFDIHRGAPEPETPQLALPRDRPGVHTIVIDPGHGGTESGAVSPQGTQEKELTLALARALQARLQARLPVKVILTRTQDETLELEERAAIANENKADLFISLHLNSSLGASAFGAETYFLSVEASDAAAAARAEAENRLSDDGAAARPEGDPLYDLQFMLWDLAQSRHLAESQAFAKLVQEELNTALGLRDRGVKQAPFRVLNGAAMPAVLVELGFLSNPEEEKRLNDPAHRAQLVDAIVRAIGRYRALQEGEPEGPKPESDQPETMEPAGDEVGP